MAHASTPQPGRRKRLRQQEAQGAEDGDSGPEGSRAGKKQRQQGESGWNQLAQDWALVCKPYHTPRGKMCHLLPWLRPEPPLICPA